MNDKWIFYAKVYWYGSNDESEIDYLVGILNSEYVNHKIKPFQTFGLFGERDIHKLPLQLQIPKYNILNPLHKEISNLSYKISQESENKQYDNNIPANKLRTEVHNNLDRNDIEIINTSVIKLINSDEKFS